MRKRPLDHDLGLVGLIAAITVLPTILFLALTLV